MCGRIRQARKVEDYQEVIGWDLRQLFELQDSYRYNVPPGTRPIVLHRLDEGERQTHRLFWGYKPPSFDRSPLGNADFTTILKGSDMWSPLLSRRVIIPADGWYEWTGPEGDKQPWYINPKDGEPILIAGITAWLPGREVLAETGFAVITDDSAGGMVDIHDRRPLVLTPEDAKVWIDPVLEVDEALELLFTPQPEAAFQWWQVTRAMGDSKYQLPDASEPIG